MSRPVTTFGITVQDKHFCPCGAPWVRIHSPEHGIKVPLCRGCGSTPRKYRLTKRHRHERISIATNALGSPIRTLQEAIEIARRAESELINGIFDVKRYHKQRPPTWRLTLGEFIEHMLKSEEGSTIAPPEKEFLEEWMIPFFSDTGTFTAGEVHLDDFLGTFKLKGERESMARGLYGKIMRLLSKKLTGTTSV